jgi:hypothetical protein
MAGSSPIVVCYTILAGFCLPAFFLHFFLAISVCAVCDLDFLPGEIPFFTVYPFLQGVVYGGLVWAMMSGGGTVRRLLRSRGVASDAVTLGGTSETRHCHGNRLRPAAVVSILLVAYAAASLLLLLPGLPPAWTADYDRARCTQIGRAIATDEYRLRGKPLDEFTRDLGLEEIPWDEGFGQGGEDRIYHFRGFALYVTVVDRPHEALSGGANNDRPGVPWIRPYPSVRVDSISDRNERMKQYWKACDEECARINAEMEREQQRNRE